jgi:L-alanine-DL-glutamate epimerase-like enolase superfamily enzyme
VLLHRVAGTGYADGESPGLHRIGVPRIPYLMNDARGGDRFDAINYTYEHCKQVREGAGRDGAWAIDFHTQLDFPDAVHLANKIEPLRPYFVEDLVRSENPGVYRTLRGR